MTYVSQFAFGFSLFYLSNYGVTLLDLNIWVCFALLFISVLFLHPSIKFGLNLPNLFLIFFNISVFVSFVIVFLTNSGSNNLQLIKSTTHYFYVFSFVLILFSPLLEPRTFSSKIIPTLIIILTIFNIYGIYQLFARIYGLPFGWLEYTNKGIFSRMELYSSVQQSIMSYGFFIRATSIFTEPSVLAGFNIYLLIFLIIPWIQLRKSFLNSNILTSIIVGTSVITLFFTYSMTGTLGFMMILLLVMFLEKFSSYRKILIIAFIIIFFLFFGNWLSKEFFHTDLFELFSFRFKSLITIGKEEIGGESLSGRLNNLLQSFYVFTEHPFWGVGMGLVGFHPKFNYLFSDSTLFSILAESGFFAGFFFIALLCSMFYYSIKLYKKVRAINNANLNVDEKKLIGIVPYIVLFEIFRTFFTLNYLSYFSFWMNISFALFVLNYYSRYLNFPYLFIFAKKN